MLSSASLLCERDCSVYKAPAVPDSQLLLAVTSVNKLVSLITLLPPELIPTNLQPGIPTSQKRKC